MLVDDGATIEPTEPQPVLQQARIVAPARGVLRLTPAERTFQGQLDGERLVLIRRPSRLLLLARCLPLTVSLLGIVLWHSSTGLLTVIAYLAAIVSVIVSAVWVIRGAWMWFGQMFILSSRRVIIQSGIMRRHIEEIELANVAQVVVERPTIMQMLCGLGNVVVRPTGTPLRLCNVWRPRMLADAILSMREQAGRGEVGKAPARQLRNKRLQASLEALMQSEPAAEPAPSPANPASHAPFGGFLQRKLPIRLIAGESVVEIIYRHWSVLLRRELSTLIVLCLLALVGIGLYVLGIGGIIALLVVLGGMVLTLLVAVLIYVDWADDVFVLTTHRVIDIDRIFFLLAEYSNDAPYSKIQDVRVEQGFWGHLLGYGSILVETAGRDQHLAMRDIPDAQGLMNRLFAQVEQVRERETNGAKNKQRVAAYQWAAQMLDAMMVEVPDVVGLPLLLAAMRLHEAGLRLVVDGERFEPGIAAGMVLAQSPQASSTALAGSEAHIVIGKAAW